MAENCVGSGAGECGDFVQVGADREKPAIAGDDQWWIESSLSLQREGTVSASTQARVRRLVPSGEMSRRMRRAVMDSNSKEEEDTRGAHVR